MSTILTGGSGGIGTSIRETIQSEKFYNLDKTHSELIGGEIFLETDLRDSESTQKSLKLVDVKKIRAIVFCAGYGGPFVPITEVEEKLWDEIFQINLKSSYLILKEILPYMKANSFGRIIFIASSLSIIGSKKSVAYSASKHAVIGMMKSIADEWGEFGITSNAISPGYVDTRMGVQDDSTPSGYDEILAKTPSKKIAQPFEIARVVKFLLSEESSYINGANWTVDGGITSI